MKNNVFKRKTYQQLLEWKNNSKGKTALLIEGARRVGKSTVVTEFAKNEYESYLIIDFAFAPKNIHLLFEDVSDINYLFLQLQLQYGVNLQERKSLIVFDEVQFCPKARQAIKLLVADHRYDYIETGSLISIRKNVENILIPSEERHINMYPMDFEEFLCATGDTVTTELLHGIFKKNTSVGDALNRELMRKFRLYMLVGGMPQAVNTYIEENNLARVDEIKRDIIRLYFDDFYKIDSTGKISALYKAIPAELSRKATRYQVGSVLPYERASTISEELAELIASNTVLPAYHANDPGAGLAANMDTRKFKLYLSDTGLMVTLMFEDRPFTENSIYKKLLSDTLPANLGILYENIAAQTLAAKGESLYYHTFPNENSTKNYEIDFVLARGNKICPIEVKSSGYKAHTSLDKFSEKYSARIGKKYLLYTKDLAKSQDVLYLPFYLAQFI
ncbi:hypothetical protein HMPREF9554_01891 [Treponema phagedenis F0421]|uniref:ATP-binding protein n=1 Tax=Treponema phagedenis TaxID=162 RepID=UPI0001F63EEC|nr:AAA family ATPase [Treponema phagedenis]EFW37611.1 hypothetical protein HMPREF9554_01891 [Treponema phagedenis F0421]